MDLEGHIAELCNEAVNNTDGGPLAQYHRLTQLQDRLHRLLGPRVTQLCLARGRVLDRIKQESGGSYEDVGRYVGLHASKQRVAYLVRQARRAARQ